MITFTNHAFKELDTSLTQLFALLGSMSRASEDLIALLPSALDHADPAMFDAAKRIDKTVNETEIAIDRLVADMINKFTITGEDLRFILAAIKVASTLERACDKLKNCIKRLGKISHPLDAAVHASLAQAIDALKLMLNNCLAQLINYQKPDVEQILAAGGQVQRSYRAILLRLHEDDMHKASGDSTHLLLVAKNLEQAADMAVEIIKIGHYVNFGTKYEKASANS